MGCADSRFMYSEEITPKREGETEIRRNRITAGLEHLISKLDEDCDTMQQVLLNSIQKFKSKQLFGSRDPNTSLYSYKTYDEVFNISKQLGAGILKLNLAPPVEESPHRKLKLIGLFSKNREECMFLEYANFLYGFTMVPLYESMGIDSMKLILHQTCIRTLFCNDHGVNLLLSMESYSQLKFVVCFDYVPPEKQHKIRAKGLTFHTITHILHAGSTGGYEFQKAHPDDIITLSYTSGTMGTPKAAMLSNKNFVSAIASLKDTDINYTTEDIHLSYLSLAHIFERYCVSACLYFGVKVCFYSGDVLKLKRDISDVRPTVFQSVPRLYSRFHTAIMEQFEKLDGFKKKIALKGVETKIENLRSKNELTHHFYDNFVFKKTKAAFGGHVRCFVSGSSSISKEILDFLKVVACCPIIETYGLTECGALAFYTSTYDSITGHEGGPASNIEFKLVDIPELNFLTENVDEKGRRLPKGELCIRGPGCMVGYFKDPKTTEEKIDAEGFIHTGDIAALLNNGAIKILERRKNVIRLSGGELIFPEKLENIYSRVIGILEVFIHGDEKHPFLVAIIVPHKEYIEDLAAKFAIPGVLDDWCRNEEIRKHFVKNMEDLSKKEELSQTEIVKQVYLDHISLVTSGCCTPSYKIKRSEARSHYGKQIEEMFSS